MTIEQQVALDEALVPHASRLRIRKSNFCLRSDITSKESTLQVVYDVLRLTPFYKALLATANVPEIYMEMLHICLRIPNQPFDELPFEEEILTFLRNLSHSGEIKKITDVNINKLHQPWRSFAAVINKSLSDFAYLLWEDFVYQVEHKDAKKSNEMYYPRFTKVIVNFFMTKDPSIPRRSKVNWHHVRDDQMFTMIKLVSRHQNTQQFGAESPKTKASVRKMQSSSKTTMPPPTAAGTRLSTSAKGKQPAKSSKAKGLYVLSKVALTEAEQMKVPDVPIYESDKEISWKSSDEDDDDDVDEQSDDEFHDDQEDEDDQDDDDQDADDDDHDSNNDGDDFVHPKLSTHDEEAKDEESSNPIVQTPSHMENSDDEGNDEASHGMNVGGDEGLDAEDDDNELYGDININLEGIDSLFESTPRVDVPVTTTDLPNFGSLFGFDHRLKTLEANFSEFMQTNQFAKAVFFIPSIVDRYIDHRMNKAVKVAIIKEQVKVQVSKILPKIDKTVNEQLGAEVLTRASNSSKTSYVVAADLSEIELKKILI
uniref:Monodehydroascorbate reductase n=1 Tax=Tanacetum cinerariifolium TaxID=118510 RepID=A0A699IXY7_TANCI|nr:hypothetical protein [Tanacetum cinerariifolium]